MGTNIIILLVLLVLFITGDVYYSFFQKKYKIREIIFKICLIKDIIILLLMIIFFSDELYFKVSLFSFILNVIGVRFIFK